MGKKFLLIAGIALLTSNSIVKGITISSRRFASCGYMSGKIYCYSGQTSAVQSDTVDNTLYSLDIAQFSGQTTESIGNKWELVVPTTPFDTEKRRIANAIVLADGKRLLVHGGYGDKYTRLVNQTIIYDATTNTWQTTLPYTEGNHGIRQIYTASVVNLPNGDAGFYGGCEQLANVAVPQITASGKSIEYWDDKGTYVGFTSLQLYSPVTASWATFNPQSNVPIDFYQAQTATLDPASGKIYFLGGTTYVDDYVPIAFSSAYTFNTKSGNWSKETLSGQALRGDTLSGKDIPTPRQYHTADLLPNSRDIIIYGGTKGDGETGTAVIDYCFTLNLISNTWTEQTSKLNIPINISGPRFSHSSVLINTTLLIIFGKGADSTLQNSLIAIDVADVEKISYLTTFGSSSDTGTPSGSGVSPTSTTLTNDGNTQNSSSSLSKGVIGGIVVGVVVVVLAIAAVILYVVHRKRKLEVKEPSERIHVDWDKIDDHYREVSPVNWNNPPNVPPHLENLTSSSKTEIYSQRFSSSTYSNEVSAVKPSSDEETGRPVVKPDAIRD